jgi:hypothetical protein
VVLPPANTDCEDGDAATVKSGVALPDVISMALILGYPVTAVSVMVKWPPLTVTG